MKQAIFTGSGVALVTPFTSGGVDYPALEKLLDFQLDRGTDAVIVCGTTGEAATMSYAERMAVIEAVVRRVDGRVPVIAGSGANCTETAIALSRDAVSAGADGLLVVTPFYNKATQRGWSATTPPWRTRRKSRSSSTTSPPAPGSSARRRPTPPWHSTPTSWA